MAYLRYTPFIEISVEKILVVDDDADILDLLGILLPKHGFIIKKVIKGEDVLKQASLFAPGLILLDINISGDGREVCKQLKSPGSLFKNVPVILFSAGCDLEKQMALCKADGFIQKPFDLLELVDKIGQYTGTVLAHSENSIS